MKVVHICTSLVGGAGIAVQRLHNGLLFLGIDSNILYLQGNSSNNKCVRYQHKVNKSVKLLKYLGIIKSPNSKYLKMLNAEHAEYECFSFPFSDFYVENHPLVRNADIINLHWVSYFINYPTFFKSVKKPIVWTLHDMNPFMGGLHYNIDLQLNPNLIFIENELKKIKHQIIEKCQNIHVVCLSKYIKEHSETSIILRKFPHYLIPNGFDPIHRNGIDKELAKQIFKLSTYEKIFLFVAHDIRVKRKGFDLLLQVINETDLPENVIFVAIGEFGEGVENNKKIKIIPRIHDQLLLEVAYSMADALIIPSREDNLPNTMMESLALGTPVIAFKVGGMPDVLNQTNGVIIDKVSVESLKDTILKFIKNEYHFKKEAIISQFQNNYSLQIQAKKYIELYHSILNNYK